MSHRILSGIAAATLGCATFAQPSFTFRNDLLPLATHSGNCLAVTDMDGDGLDDIALLDDASHARVFYQNDDGTFEAFNYGSMAFQPAWGAAVGDFENDGHKDFICGGHYDGAHYLRIQGRGQSMALSTFSEDALYMQCMSLGDLDNDGGLDAMGCNDDGAPVIWMNDGNGGLEEGTPIDFATEPESDMSGNYGSVFTDFDQDGDLDLYIAHCRQGVNDPTDPRRWDRLFINDGTGHFTDEAEERGVLNDWQTWAVDFGDWDNDGDMDLVTVNHDRDMQLLENDGTGHFTEIPNDLQVVGFLLQVHMEDFDNDGFLDILVGGWPSFFLQGHGDGTFTPVEDPFTGYTVASFAVGDLNNDGAMDVWTAFAEGYNTPSEQEDILWLNDGNDDHWLNVRLQGVESNRGAVGATVVLETALGRQVRQVRAGESYGLTNTSMCHFGLGASSSIATLTITWPSGQVDTYEQLDTDNTYTFIEGVSTTGIATAPSADALQVYPVPANGTFSIAFGDIAGEVDMDLLDLSGRTVRSEHSLATSAPRTWDATGLAAGRYTLRVRHAGGVDTRKVVLH